MKELRKIDLNHYYNVMASIIEHGYPKANADEVFWIYYADRAFPLNYLVERAIRGQSDTVVLSDSLIMAREFAGLGFRVVQRVTGKKNVGYWALSFPADQDHRRKELTAAGIWHVEDTTGAAATKSTLHSLAKLSTGDRVAIRIAHELGRKDHYPCFGTVVSTKQVKEGIIQIAYDTNPLSVMAPRNATIKSGEWEKPVIKFIDPSHIKEVFHESPY